MKNKIVFFAAGMALFVLSIVLEAEGIINNGMAELIMIIGLLIVFIPLALFLMTTLRK